MSYRELFGDFDGRVWLNCAHQGPLPLAAAAAAREAIEWKVVPRRLSGERFAAVPARLRGLLGRLIGADPDEITLTNGSSYGIHLLANGLPLEPGDEVLLTASDFPSDILPWMNLRRRGVEVTLVEPAEYVPTVAEIDAALRPATRVVCMPWVHSFSGCVADLAGIGALCREHGVLFLVNATQGLGARRLAVDETPVDAIFDSGWKWLCGPYSTGFCWLRPELRSRLEYNQAYWQAVMTADDLGRESLDLTPPPRDHPRRFDIFATANFFNYVPWAEAIALILEIGPDTIAAHDQRLVDRLLTGIAGTDWTVTSPLDPERRSTLVFLTLGDQQRNLEAQLRLEAAGVDAAFRRGRLRLAPHFYNTDADIDRVLDLLT